MNNLKYNKNISIVLYQYDVNSLQNVNLVIQDVIKKFKKLDGLIHFSGSIRDNFILKKNIEI
ncbi:hypothetical protein AB8Q19_00080 [Candidatus Profftella armatura]